MAWTMESLLQGHKKTSTCTVGPDLLLQLNAMLQSSKLQHYLVAPPQLTIVQFYAVLWSPMHAVKQLGRCRYVRMSTGWKGALCDSP
jgi:hypothetical protein